MVNPLSVRGRTGNPLWLDVSGPSYAGVHPTQEIHLKRLGCRSRPKVLAGIRTGRRRYGRGPAWASFLIGTSACISSVLVFQLQRRDFSSSAAVRRACARADVTFSTARRRVGGRAAWGAWWVWLMTVGLCF